MKINSSAFGAAGAAAEKRVTESTPPSVRPSFVPRGGSDSEGRVDPDLNPEPVDDRQKIQDSVLDVSDPTGTPTAGAPMFTKARKGPAQDVVTGTAAEAHQDSGEGKAESKRVEKSRLHWAWKRSKSTTETEPKSSAMVPNNSRPLVIVAAVFVGGLIVGPWIVQNATPSQQQPAGPNPSVQAVADTLKGGAFGSAPSAPANPVEPGVVAGTVQDEPKAEIPMEGEARYEAMLARMKQGGAEAQEPVKIVPKISQSTTPSSGAGMVKQESANAPVDPYPKEAIPLDIEHGTAKPKDEPKTIAIEQGIAPSGRYIVLRIERNQQGIPAALLMPIGGRQAIDSAWVFVGDATSDGLVIENITSNTVVMKTATGRSIQIALH